MPRRARFLLCFFERQILPSADFVVCVRIDRGIPIMPIRSKPDERGTPSRHSLKKDLLHEFAGDDKRINFAVVDNRVCREIKAFARQFALDDKQFS